MPELFQPKTARQLGTAELFARQRTLMRGFYIRNMPIIIVALLLPELASSILHWIFGETGSTLQSAARTVIAVALHPFPAIVLMLIYLDMRVRKESYNAVQLAAALEATPQLRPV